MVIGEEDMPYVEDENATAWREWHGSFVQSY
jgi:hypothetical protein